MNATYIGFGLYTIIGFDDTVCPGTNIGKKSTIIFSRKTLDGLFVVLLCYLGNYFDKSSFTYLDFLKI